MAGVKLWASVWRPLLFVRLANSNRRRVLAKSRKSIPRNQQSWLAFNGPAITRNGLIAIADCLQRSGSSDVQQPRLRITNQRRLRYGPRVRGLPGL